MNYKNTEPSYLIGVVSMRYDPDFRGGKAVSNEVILYFLLIDLVNAHTLLDLYENLLLRGLD